MTVRGLAAYSLSYSHCGRPLHWAIGRLFGGFVLAFHSLAPERFRQLIEALRPNEPVHLGELVDRLKAQKRSDGLFAITVDDRVGDNVRPIAAVAAELHWPVTFFLPTRYLDDRWGMPFQWLDNVLPWFPNRRITSAAVEIDGATALSRQRFATSIRRLMCTRPADEYVPLIENLVDCAVRNGWRSRQQLEPPPPISWEEVAQLARHPAIRFESHGVTHTAVSALSLARLEAELLESRRTISERTNRPCRHFCYPFGGPESIGNHVPPVVGQYYESAVTMSRGRVNARNPLFLPRIPLYAGDTAAIARLKVLTR